MIPERLAQARTFGCETIDLREEGTLRERIHAIVRRHDRALPD